MRRCSRPSRHKASGERWAVISRQISRLEAASSWPYAPRLFAEDLESAFDLIEQFPHAGESLPPLRTPYSLFVQTRSSPRCRS
jgi:hypothetical protein